MTYVDRRRKGSFRGVPFFTVDHTLEGGQRGSVHEYPGRDDYTTQSLGKAPKRFTVTAKLYGLDYDLLRDRLIEALDQGGPGKLVHRYFGEFDAEVEPGKIYSLKESEEGGGTAVFTIPFIRSGTSKAPTAKADSRQAVKIAADAVHHYARAKFYAEVNQHGPEWLRDKLLGALNTASSAMRSVARSVNGTLAITAGVAGAIDDLANAAAVLIASPTVVLTIADRIADINDSIFGAFVTVGQELQATINAFHGQPTLEAARSTVAGRRVGRALNVALSGLMNASDPELDESTSLNEQSSRNTRDVFEVMKTTGAAAAATAALELPYDSPAAVNAVRDVVADALGELAAATNGDDLYQALVDLRALFSEHMALRAGAIPSPATHTPSVAMPALVVAQLMHGDARRGDEIVARNNVRHPGFCAPGVALEVASD